LISTSPKSRPFALNFYARARPRENNSDSSASAWPEIPPRLAGAFRDRRRSLPFFPDRRLRISHLFSLCRFSGCGFRVGISRLAPELVRAIATLRHSFAARMTSFVWGTTAGGRGHVTRVDKAFACASTSCPPLVRSSACNAWRNNRRISLSIFHQIINFDCCIFYAVRNHVFIGVQFVLLSLDIHSAAGTRKIGSSSVNAPACCVV
jgi:hypothetical protein